MNERLLLFIKNERYVMRSLVIAALNPTHAERQKCQIVLPFLLL